MTKSRKPPIVEIKSLSVTFAENNLQALEDVSFSIRAQEFVCVLGASGSGKTTLLRTLAGLITPTRGRVAFALNPKIGFVFQDPNLMPWRNVVQNIMLPLEVENSENAKNKADELIELVGLRGFENAYPRELSGGMAQRVALARALIHDPNILLLDEPFASLDALTRERMGTELSRIWQAHKKTVVMVTHSISEALFLADRVLVLTPRPGKIKLDLKVDLPRPRKDEIRYSAKFVALAKKLKKAIE
jgi:NitT/TauT family transport system ATP-binding protein